MIQRKGGFVSLSLGVAVNAGKGGLDGIADEEAVVDAEDRQLRRDFHVCGVCGDTRRTAELPALGHDFVETARQEPTETEAGWIDYACARCGETKRDVLPPSEPTTTTPNGRKRNEKALR